MVTRKDKVQEWFKNQSGSYNEQDKNGFDIYYENCSGDWDEYGNDGRVLNYHYDFWMDGDIGFMNIICK